MLGCDDDAASSTPSPTPPATTTAWWWGRIDSCIGLLFAMMLLLLLCTCLLLAVKGMADLAHDVESRPLLRALDGQTWVRRVRINICQRKHTCITIAMLACGVAMMACGVRCVGRLALIALDSKLIALSQHLLPTRRLHALRFIAVPNQAMLVLSNGFLNGRPPGLRGNGNK